MCGGLQSSKGSYFPYLVMVMCSVAMPHAHAHFSLSVPVKMSMCLRSFSRCYAFEER